MGGDGEKIMTTLEKNSLIQTLKDLLTEAYDGPPDPSATWFIDNEPNSGILGILEGVTAAEASTSSDGSGGSGTTIAAHVEHLRWSLANAIGALRGEPYNPNWGESWELLQVDEAEWDRLCGQLRQEFEVMVQALQKQEVVEGEYLYGLLALIPHAAYHLGSIRQMIERVRE